MGYTSHLDHRNRERETSGPQHEALVDLETASAVVGVSTQALLSSVDLGVIPAYRIDGQLRFRPCELPGG